MLNLWKYLMAMFVFQMMIDDPNGGGASGDLDFVIDDDPTPPEETSTKKGGDPTSKSQPPTDNTGGKDEKPDPVTASLDEETKKELDELKQFRDESLREKAISEANAKLVKTYPDFDLNAITTKLKEIHAEDPDLAADLNNPTGWENLYLKYFRKGEVEVDPFDAGRGGANEPFDFKEVQKNALSGDKRAMKTLFRNAK